MMCSGSLIVKQIARGEDAAPSVILTTDWSVEDGSIHHHLPLSPAARERGLVGQFRLTARRARS